jgi:hypothetical protein
LKRRSWDTSLMPHLFIFAFAFLLVAAMELTWPVKQGK